MDRCLDIDRRRYRNKAQFSLLICDNRYAFTFSDRFSHAFHAMKMYFVTNNTHRTIRNTAGQNNLRHFGFYLLSVLLQMHQAEVLGYKFGAVF